MSGFNASSAAFRKTTRTAKSLKDVAVYYSDRDKVLSLRLEDEEGKKFAVWLDFETTQRIRDLLKEK